MNDTFMMMTIKRLSIHKGGAIMLNQYGDILTIDDVCEVLMVGRNRVYELLNEDQIHGFRNRKIIKKS